MVMAQFPSLLGLRVGKRVRQLRIAKGLKQEDMCRFGFDYKYYQRIEYGEKNLTLKSLNKLAKAFGKAVRELRLQKGVTQQELADKCGLDLSYVGGIERGQRNPTLGVIHALAQVLDARPPDLLKKAKH